MRSGVPGTRKQAAGPLADDMGSTGGQTVRV
jgi:hypothetical protein